MVKAAKVLWGFIFVLFSCAATAQISTGTPAWFLKDIQRQAKWLPASIRRSGFDVALQQRWAALPQDIQQILVQAKIPGWMIALIPTDVDKQEEINKQIRGMVNLSGDPAVSAVGDRAEQLLIFAGSAQLPTPGDEHTGASLGAEGCTAAMSRYVIAQLKLEFPVQLAAMPDRLANLQSSDEMKSVVVKAARSGAGWLVVKDVPFERLQNSDVEPGSIMIGQKPGGTHVFGWTRVPRFWNWMDGDKMAIGNTGLPQFGDRMILAQEFLTDHPEIPSEFYHNEHGPLNSRQVIMVNGRPNLSDPRTNVYAARGSDFIIISFR